MGASPVPVVSVIVPAHNAACHIDRLLSALVEQTLTDPYEIIVVDDASTDATPQRVARWPTVRYVRADPRAGAYAARNRGLEAARGSILAFTDADCAPMPSWLARGVEALGAGIDLVAGGIETDLAARPSIAALVDSIRFLDQELYATVLGYGATANLLARRSVFDRVGAFNERLRSGGDREFGMRATDAGAVIRYAPQAVVRHESRDTLRALAWKSIRIGRGMASQRRHAHGRAQALAPPPWRLYLYVPPRRVPGWHRLDDNLPLRRRALVRPVDYLAAQLPTAAGLLVGTVFGD
jgi:glycosyltransferase involved in cell wall biosynthesis